MEKVRPTPLQVSPTDRDLDNVKVINEAHPEFATQSDVLRHALELARRQAERELLRLKALRIV
jgi:hypothetical protein